MRAFMVFDTTKAAITQPSKDTTACGIMMPTRAVVPEIFADEIRTVLLLVSRPSQLWQRRNTQILHCVQNDGFLLFFATSVNC
jgi:hypothetical protein